VAGRKYLYRNFQGMVKRFFASRRTGFYLGVIREGEVGEGDEIEVIARDPNGVPVSEITRLYAEKQYGDSDVTSLRKVLQVAALPETWKEYFRERLDAMNPQRARVQYFPATAQSEPNPAEGS
jgi:MOSC domain-containing protein YiiM